MSMGNNILRINSWLWIFSSQRFNESTSKLRPVPAPGAFHVAPVPANFLRMTYPVVRGGAVG